MRCTDLDGDWVAADLTIHQRDLTVRQVTQRNQLGNNRIPLAPMAEIVDQRTREATMSDSSGRDIME